MRWLQGKPSRTHASLDARAPLRRSEDLILEELGDELLVYDKTNKRAHCLSPDAARVWRACDGSMDTSALSAQLGLPRDVVRRALDELQNSELLDQGLELVNVGSENGNGTAVTRRELAVRSAKVGTAAATAPLILSLAVPSAAMAATLTFGQCAIYSSQSCGNNPGQCGFYDGCCCCCSYQGATGNCFACTSLGTCTAPVSGNTCPPGLGTGGPGTRANCASGNTGANPVGTQGCCGPQGNPGATNCGCLYTTTGQISGTPGSNPTGCGPPPATPCGPGGPGGGAGCCNPTLPGSPSCAPGDTTGNCVPCCNGTPIGPSALPGCCATPTSTCPST